MLIQHEPLVIDALLKTSLKLTQTTGDQIQRFICKQTHNLSFEVHDEMINPEEFNPRPEDHTTYLMVELARLCREPSVYAEVVTEHMESLLAFAQGLLRTGFQMDDLIFNSNSYVVQMRLRFTQVTSTSIRSVTVIVSLDSFQYRDVWCVGYPGWTDVVYDSPGAIRSVTLYSLEDDTKLASIRINTLTEEHLPFSGIDYPSTYNLYLYVTKAVDVHHELDGTAYVLRHRGFIYDRPVEIIRMDLIRFPSFYNPHNR